MDVTRMKTSRLGLPVKQQKRWTEATLGPLDQAHTHSARATVQTPRKPRLTTHKQYPIPLIAVKRMAGGREWPLTISLSGREGGDSGLGSCTPFLLLSFSRVNIQSDVAARAGRLIAAPVPSRAGRLIAAPVPSRAGSSEWPATSGKRGPPLLESSKLARARVLTLNPAADTSASVP